MPEPCIVKSSEKRQFKNLRRSAEPFPEPKQDPVPPTRRVQRPPIFRSKLGAGSKPLNSALRLRGKTIRRRCRDIQKQPIAACVHRGVFTDTVKGELRRRSAYPCSRKKGCKASYPKSGAQSKAISSGNNYPCSSGGLPSKNTPGFRLLKGGLLRFCIFRKTQAHAAPKLSPWRTPAG